LESLLPPPLPPPPLVLPQVGHGDFDLVGEGGVGNSKRGVSGNELLKDSLLLGHSARNVLQGIVDGVKEARVVGVGVSSVGLAQGISPPYGMEAAGSLLVGSTVGSLPGSPGLVSGVKFLPKLGGAGKVSAARRVVEARTVRVWSVMGRGALAALR
jgi:hypothetical protein